VSWQARYCCTYAACPPCAGVTCSTYWRATGTFFLGASTQLGFDYFLAHEADLAGGIGIEAGYGVDISSYRKTFGSFKG